MTSDYLLHVKLAHLYLIVREEGKEAFLAVYDNAKDRIATFLYASYRFLIVACRFVLDKDKIEGKATMLVEC